MADIRDDVTTKEGQRTAASDRAAEKSRADQARNDAGKQADTDKARADAEQKAEEGRKALYERERQMLEEKQKADEARIAAEREKKEEERRVANLSPEERAAEISPFVHSAPHHPLVNEPIHPTEFILSEANGHRSRGNCYLADPVTVLAGQMLKKTAEATATQPPTYVLAAAGADCQAIAMYSGGSIPGEGLRISAIVRDAEVNGLCLVWGSISQPEQLIAITTLAAQGIIVRL